MMMINDPPLQAMELPAMDMGGVSDPYVKVTDILTEH